MAKKLEDFLKQFGKEPSPVRTFRDYKARFWGTLTDTPRKPVGDHGNRRLSAVKKEVLTEWRPF